MLTKQMEPLDFALYEDAPRRRVVQLESGEKRECETIVRMGVRTMVRKETWRKLDTEVEIRDDDGNQLDLSTACDNRCDFLNAFHAYRLLQEAPELPRHPGISAWHATVSVGQKRGTFPNYPKSLEEWRNLLPEGLFDRIHTEAPSDFEAAITRLEDLGISFRVYGFQTLVTGGHLQVTDFLRVRGIDTPEKVKRYQAQCSRKARALYPTLVAIDSYYASEQKKPGALFTMTETIRYGISDEQLIIGLAIMFNQSANDFLETSAPSPSNEYLAFRASESLSRHYGEPAEQIEAKLVKCVTDMPKMRYPIIP
jgi:hypothetical protein